MALSPHVILVVHNKDAVKLPYPPSFSARVLKERGELDSIFAQGTKTARYFSVEKYSSLNTARYEESTLHKVNYRTIR